MSQFLFTENTTEEQYQNHYRYHLQPSRRVSGFSFPANPDTHTDAIINLSVYINTEQATYAGTVC